MGITVKELRRIFFYQGVLVTALGGVVGILIGSILTLIQRTTGFVRITPSLPYPMEFKFFDVFVVLTTIMVLGIIAAKIASSRITRKLLA